MTEFGAFLLLIGSILLYLGTAITLTILVIEVVLPWYIDRP